VAGDDAATFLHSQLTNAVEDLTASTARLAGYCSPKGRLIASFLMWRDADGIVLQLSADIQPPIQKRLTMFVLRAKAKLSDLSATHGILGIAGAGAEAALQQAGLPAPQAPLATASNDDVTVIRLADADGEPRWQIVAPAARIEALQQSLGATLAVASPAFWDWLDVASGIPRIAAATQEQFVPQMINFELIGGVNFRKGCYPGQEVVARSQYRGTLKRRMWRVRGRRCPGCGGGDFPPRGSGAAVRYAGQRRAAPQGGWEGLAELKIDAANGALHLGAASGPAVSTGALPYEVPLPNEAEAAG
jgi:folate-binding protein YgfZ